MADLARVAVTASFAPDEVKTRLLDEVANYVAANPLRGGAERE